ncbi:MAG: hypothetical protein SGJ24_05940 [Chloroflexota bacterium]|nr:hypothetical protein [Chloroflexota bacterium]
MPTGFNLDTFLPRALFDRITDVRVADPRQLEQIAFDRVQRRDLAPSGKLTILAADHPGRGVIAVGGESLRMGDRRDYLARIVRILLGTAFDGVMGTPDVIDELMILDHLFKRAGGASFLDGRVLIGCMQRGGVTGFTGEIDDRFGAYTADSIRRSGLNGGKMLVRFDAADERTLRTLAYCGRAVTKLNENHLASFVEPLHVRRVAKEVVQDNDADSLTRLVGICAALGDSSRYMWLKLPYCDGFERVAGATTLPILLLGGISQEDPRDSYHDIAAGMRASANVRGVMVGRNVLYPGEYDPAAVAHAVQGIVYDGLNADSAEDAARAYQGIPEDALTRFIHL